VFPNVFRVLPEDRKSQCRRLFDLVAAPGLHNRTFQIDGEEGYANPSDIIHDFGRDAWCLKHMHEDLISYILDPEVLDLTDDQYALFCRIRVAELVHSVTLEEILLQQNERYDEVVTGSIAGSTALHHLRTIMTPVPVPETDDDPDCPICREPLWQSTENIQDQEAAVRLPCRGRHVFGRDCLESWVKRSGSPVICPMCRAQFDEEASVPNAIELATRRALMPDPIDFATRHVLNEDFQPVEYGWLSLFRSTWVLPIGVRAY
jgi:hypothetical protein